LVGASGSISKDRETSRKISPKRNKGASTFPALKTDGSAKAFFKISRAALNEALMWKSAGKYASLLLQEAQEG
jgi:hypothetical protein